MEQAFSESASGAMRSTGVGAPVRRWAAVSGRRASAPPQGSLGQAPRAPSGGSQAGGQPCFSGSPGDVC